MQCPQCRHENPAGQKFCGECGARLASAAPAPAPPVDRYDSPASYTPKHLAEKILTSKAAIEGERKLVTVMFADVSGFTALSEQLDPEELHAIMDRAFEVILAAVHAYEGTINQFLGDGVMALFGAPIAHEDHAGRALRAALAIQSDLEPLRADVQRMYGRDFRVRLGVNSGPVVVGAIGRDLRMDYTAQGDSVNTAARLLGVAQPGQIVVSRRTKDPCEGFFVFEDLGEFTLKGKREPVPAFAVTRELRGRTRLEVSKERGLTVLVGRRAERERLAAMFAETCEGPGRVAIIAGEPGVGKSRLLYEFLRRLDDSGHIELETTCASYGGGMAYRAASDLYRRYFDLSEEMSLEQTQRRLADRLESLGLAGDEPLFLLSHFLGLSVPSDFLLRVQGAQLRDRTNALLSDVLARESERTPVVVIVENVHWIDASSEELVKALARATTGKRVMLVLTTRPTTAVAWAPPQTETIKLEGLDPEAIHDMLHAIVGADSVSEPLFQFLLSRTEGNPLYVEEFVRQLQETGGLVVEDGEARLCASGESVPESVRDIIAARVDRLAEAAKVTLQIASVVGRRFGVPLVSRVNGADPAEVAAHLRELHATDFVFPLGGDGEPMYSFKHALTQDVVYASLLDRRRRQLHGGVGRGLEELYVGRTGDVVELLAHHYDRSGDDERAVDFAIEAALKAQRRWANTEALALFERALARLAAMPDTEPNRLRKIDAVVSQAEVKFALGKHHEHVHAMEAIRDTVDRVSDPRRRAAWSYWTGFLHSIAGAPPEVSIAHCREALAIASANGLDEIRGYAECTLTHVYSVSGDLREGLQAGHRALEIFEKRGNVWWICRTLWGLMSVANGLGEWRDSLAYCTRALEYGQQVNDLRLKVVGWWRLGSTHVQRGDPEPGLRCAEQALALSPIPLDAATAKAVRAYALIKLGDLDTGIQELEQIMDWLERSHLGHLRWFYGYFLAEGYLRRDEPAKAATLVEGILATSRAESRRAEGIGERLLGEALLTLDGAAAREHLDAATKILEAMGARNELARTIAARGELHRLAGDMAGAERCYREALAIFQELETIDEVSRTSDMLRRLAESSVA